jgi:hypothetical protein
VKGDFVRSPVEAYDEYADLLKIRLASTECRRFVVEGVDWRV